MEYKKGDKVVSVIDGTIFGRKLTKHQVYTIRSFTSKYATLTESPYICDSVTLEEYPECLFNADYFMSLTKFRKMKIDKINGKH